MLHSRINNKSGYSLIWVIIVSVVGIILGAAVLSLAMGEVRHAAISERQLQVNNVARSGVEVGFQVLQDISPTSTSTTLIDFVNVANQYLITQGLKTKQVGNGTYTITFIADPTPGSYYILIRSDAIHNSNSAIKNTVDLYVESTLVRTGQMNWSEPPKSWIRASNLWDGVNPEINIVDDYTGQAVVFTGTPIKSPQNSTDPAIFRASLLYFRGYDKNTHVSFLQQINTNIITLDAEVIILDGKLFLRDLNKSLFLRSSNEVLDYYDEDFVPWTFNGSVGFENKARYDNFIAPHVGMHDSYGFDETGSKYGLISITADLFTSGVYKNDLSQPAVVPDGVYFYRDGVNLNNNSPLLIGTTHRRVGGSENDLIIVKTGDPIITAITENQGIRYIRASVEKFMYQSK